MTSFIGKFQNYIIYNVFLCTCNQIVGFMARMCQNKVRRYKYLKKKNFLLSQLQQIQLFYTKNDFPSFGIG
jgi:hypothetical protein